MMLALPWVEKPGWQVCASSAWAASCSPGPAFLPGNVFWALQPCPYLTPVVAAYSQDMQDGLGKHRESDLCL